MKPLTEQQATDAMILYQSFDLSKGVEEIARCAKAISLSIDITFAEAITVLNQIIEAELTIKNLLINL